MEKETPKDDLQPMQLPEKKKAHTMLFVAVIVLLLGGLGYMSWLWWAAAEDKAKLETANSSLQSQLDQLRAELSAKQKDKTDDDLDPCDSTISADLQANIRDAIGSGNTAALEGYMTNPVNVILAASEGLGNRTPAQAVVDLDYLDAATAPWNFSLPPATLANYQAGFYTDYFKNNSVVGKSADNMVVSFSFDDCAKIKTVFMSAAEDLLLP